MCGEFCTLPALFLRIIFSFSFVARCGLEWRLRLESRVNHGRFKIGPRRSLDYFENNEDGQRVSDGVAFVTSPIVVNEEPPTVTSHCAVIQILVSERELHGRGRWECAESEDNSGKMLTKRACTFGCTIKANRELFFVPGGSGMYILVPWKPVVVVWGLLSAMIFFGFVASSVLQGKDPFAPRATITQPAAAKTGTAQSGQQPKHSNKAARTPSQ